MTLELRELVVTAEVGGDPSEGGCTSDRPVSSLLEPSQRRQLIREVAEWVLEALARRKED